MLFYRGFNEKGHIGNETGYAHRAWWDSDKSRVVIAAHDSKKDSVNLVGEPGIDVFVDKIPGARIDKGKSTEYSTIFSYKGLTYEIIREIIEFGTIESPELVLD